MATQSFLLFSYILSVPPWVSSLFLHKLEVINCGSSWASFILSFQTRYLFINKTEERVVSFFLFFPPFLPSLGNSSTWFFTGVWPKDVAFWAVTDSTWIHGEFKDTDDTCPTQYWGSFLAKRLGDTKVSTEDTRTLTAQHTLRTSL